MRNVLKYILRYDEPLMMPSGARVLSVHEQHGYPTLWAEVDTSMPTVQYWYRLICIGAAVDTEWTFVGTVHVDGEVLHIYVDLTRHGGCRL